VSAVAKQSVLYCPSVVRFCGSKQIISNTGGVGYAFSYLGGVRTWGATSWVNPRAVSTGTTQIWYGPYRISEIRKPSMKFQFADPGIFLVLYAGQYNDKYVFENNGIRANSALNGYWVSPGWGVPVQGYPVHRKRTNIAHFDGSALTYGSPVFGPEVVADRIYP
jgi:hypothetical protein